MAKKSSIEKKPAKKSRFGIQLELFSREAELQRDIEQRKKEGYEIEPGKPFENFRDDLPWLN